MTESSRRTWPGPMSTAGVGEGHSHDLPPALLKRVRFLWWAVVIFGVCLAVLAFLFISLIQSRSAERRTQSDRLQQEIRDSWCTALDTFPEGGALDALRVQYGCGPGIPLEDLPPEQAERLRQWRTENPAPTVAPQAAAPTPTAPAPTVEPSRAAPGPPMPAEPSRSTEPPPVVNLGPVTDMACDSVRVCF